MFQAIAAGALKGDDRQAGAVQGVGHIEAHQIVPQVKPACCANSATAGRMSSNSAANRVKAAALSGPDGRGPGGVHWRQAQAAGWIFSDIAGVSIGGRGGRGLRAVRGGRIEHVRLLRIARAHGVQHVLPGHGAQRQIHLWVGDAAGHDAMFVGQRGAPGVAAREVRALIIHIAVLAGDRLAGAHAAPAVAVRTVQRRKAAHIIIGHEGGPVRCALIDGAPGHGSAPAFVAAQGRHRAGERGKRFLALFHRAKVGFRIVRGGRFQNGRDGLSAFLCHAGGG